MAKLEDFDLTKERLELQEAFDSIRLLINNGNFEIETTNASEPAFDAPQETKIVLSIFGAQYRLYISFLGDWYYTTLTKLP